MTISMPWFSAPAQALDDSQPLFHASNISLVSDQALVSNDLNQSRKETKIAAASAPKKEEDVTGDKKVLDAQKTPGDSGDHHESLTPNALQLAKMLNVVEPMEDLKSKAHNTAQSRDDVLDIMILREKLSRAIQYAALELEEALANIEGDLATANMQYSFFSARHDRAVMLNNIAAFTSSGGLGVLDSASGIKHGAPLPNIFGITGNALAVGIPLLGLIPPKYKLPTNDHNAARKGNMLAPLFGRDYAGSGYDPIVWNYLQAVPADSTNGMTRIQTLLKSWQSYRGLAAKDQKSKETIDILSGIVPKDKKISLDLLKTKSELLVELRSQVQQMYKDISDLNTNIMNASASH
ncbi:MAG: hypothetical protein SGJ27_23080 [Candidatus Melainabacteria bacterium]|nr:hypothetical protein [Candidatus Melainabacteria bacterium]